ncbi:grasp-with-spasm system ATP-grasp peptide maturase [Flagellimonas meridianipacifica]|uniref:ATP-GRASP peptide maturase of grasp-with-spasm system n=1 Tax=Flagellimonas meridianipacifica TaxID=1080225 RepID=A0A2T0MCQ8_9FLAO|nr:grasp-with-spasm system ATP-grasp peptide maturase [Allomuricauda pacifica]PRX55259.1 ATP-GRASP peptide maturase of grasp-with-spasm system [Allomuricauda pacifica]
MILILSQENYDPSTSDVQNWLDYYGAKYKRINGADIFKDFTTDLGNSNFDQLIEEVNVVWFRRWLEFESRFKITYEDLPEGVLASENNLLRLSEYVKNETRVVNNFFFDLFKEKVWLSDPRKIRLSKLRVLQLAKTNGLLTPYSLVTTSKLELIRFKNQHGRVISKNLNEVQVFTDLKSKYHSSKTIEVDNDFIENISENFFPSFFQSLIEKEYELRVFFLDDEFYPMAIFSQLDKKTKIDFRNYNNDNPNRCVPYELDEKIKFSLKKLMADLNLKTGSIDLIKSIDGKYYFLEVNPVGQFGMTSFPCNYKLEKKIAEYLIQLDKTNE